MSLSIERRANIYVIDGELYDRTSKVLEVIAKPGLDAWKQKHGPDGAARLLKEAGELGTEVHAIVEAICRGSDPWPRFAHDGRTIVIQGTRLEPYYRGYVRWHEVNVRQTILIEQIVWSPEHGYAGTLDNFAELTDNRLALLDVKTSRYLSWTYRLQTAAYWGALLEQQRVPEIDTRAIVHLSSKEPGTVRFVEYPDPERDYGVWLGTLDLYRMSQRFEDDWKRTGDPGRRPDPAAAVDQWHS